MPKWDANLYLQFGRERTQAAIDLVSRIALDAPVRIIDLGCGPGNSTVILRERYPNAKIVGLDSSADMIEQARDKELGVEWRLGDIAGLETGDTYDLIFANAALQWIPDHKSLFQNLVSHLNEGGALAVQLPYHHASPLQQVVLEASRHSAWDDRMELARSALTYEESSFYYDTLSPLCGRIDLWETEYITAMDSPEAVLDFIRGSGLRPFVQALESDDGIAEFESKVLEGYRKAYPVRENGKVLFPFKRQFIVAYS